MSEGEKPLVDKSESSSFEDLASAAAHEIEEAKLAEAAAAEKEKSAETQKDEWQDLLGSGALLKKIIKSGDDSEGLRPHRGDICRISYEIKIKDSNEHYFEKRDQIKIYVGDNEILQGLDLALTLMYKGEACHLHLAPRFGYGESGLKPGESLGLIGEADGPKYDGSVIGPDTWLEAKLELHDWSEEPEHETLSIAERMEIGIRRRTRGNWWYGRGEPQLAIQLYRRALDVLDESEGGITDPTPSGELAQASDALQELLEERLRVHNNMAAAQLKAGAFDAALQAVTRVLSCQPKNAKALYRKSRILSAMGRNAEALEAARAAAGAAPGDAGARRELQRCEQKATRDRSVERRLAKRMLGTASPKPGAAPDKKPSRAKMLVWGSLLLSLLVGVASVLVYRYKVQAH
ncbi:PREDICTED: peptidyl-prolyl cis-trans isomerase FKBP8 [Papilio xuthus]|uniref:peptidylprolyl isomerase n=1 Tax=Papilio xuthus TaxID=66420 RepID=A0A194QCV5_PAPXU|nr:PREDICTED: peptidyl-prolyl cis-trans isomerase FKBP8 [Papilio xuthus]XP_013163195.1 PREDICTED: peptidyl-prolyl cis-trans isomerase FKBP8 [Papilio xuthus]KPJ03297.1 Peptidyl-prolyl cis-trans isomerase FKBP8 [Papilio xuthus]